MKKVLIFALALVMLLACVACSNNNQTDNTDPTSGSKLPSINNTTPGQNENPSGNNGNENNDAGYKPVLPAELPIELRHPTFFNLYQYCTKIPFEANDPRKIYLENKYGVTAYLLECAPMPDYNQSSTHFTLEGFEDSFVLTNDYVDTAWFAVMYPDIQTYFAKVIQDSGITVDRVIVESKCTTWDVYDHTKPFADAFATAPATAKKFNLTIYGSSENTADSDVVSNLLFALEELNMSGNVNYRVVSQDISEVTNTQLLRDGGNVYSTRGWDYQMRID